MESQINISVLLVIGTLGILLFALFLIYYLILKLKKTNEEKRLLKSNFQEVEEKYNQIELENLDSRLNPHLFKNILIGIGA